MGTITIPKGYKSDLNLHDTQIAIKTVKDFFQTRLAQELNLARVSAPLFCRSGFRIERQLKRCGAPGKL